MARAGELRDEVRDRVELTELLARFATGIDTCDWSMYRSVFTDEIDLDYSSWRPELRDRWRADDWVTRASHLFPGLTASRHALTNVVVTFDPDDADVARVRANIAADHVLGDRGATEVFTVNGHYDDWCVRTASGWRIARKRLVVEWTTGDRSLLDRGAARVAADAPDLRVPATAAPKESVG